MEKLKQIRVLIIEDNEVTAFLSKRAFLKTKLEPFNDKILKCQIARSLKKGLKLISVFNPHLILLDLNLIDSDTENTVEKIKEIKAKSTAAILILTGSAPVELIETAIKNGATSYLSKPLSNITKTLSYSIAEAIDRKIDSLNRKKILNFL